MFLLGLLHWLILMVSEYINYLTNTSVYSHLSVYSHSSRIVVKQTSSHCNVAANPVIVSIIALMSFTRCHYWVVTCTLAYLVFPCFILETFKYCRVSSRFTSVMLLGSVGFLFNRRNPHHPYEIKKLVSSRICWYLLNSTYVYANRWSTNLWKKIIINWC